jgi:hypothetical protein
MFIVIFYVIFTAIISLVTFVVDNSNIPSSDYNLNASKPGTIFLAPFVNEPFSNLLSSIQALALVLFFGIAIMGLTLPGFVKNREYVLPICLGPIGGGLISSMIVSLSSRIGGSGTSVIDASLLGIIVVSLLFVSYLNYKRRKFPSSVFVFISGLVLILLFIQAFYLAGNGPVHTMGFVVGVLLAGFSVGRSLGGSKAAGSKPSELQAGM